MIRACCPSGATAVSDGGGTALDLFENFLGSRRGCSNRLVAHERGLRGCHFFHERQKPIHFEMHDMHFVRYRTKSARRVREEAVLPVASASLGACSMLKFSSKTFNTHIFLQPVWRCFMSTVLVLVAPCPLPPTQSSARVPMKKVFCENFPRLQAARPQRTL